MQVIVHFADGEVMEGSSEAMTLSKMGFPFVPHSGNNELVWISLSSIKYVVILGGNLEPALGGDPREGRGLPKIVIRFHDGETIRTYRDDSWGQESEGFNIRIWEPKLQAVVRVLVSLHSIKGIFFVCDWDSRSESERLEFATKTKAGPARPKAAARPAPGEPDAQMVQLTLKYRQRLARLSDPDLTSGDPVVFARAVEKNLGRLVHEDGGGIPIDQHRRLADAIVRGALGFGPLDALLLDESVTEVMVNGPDQVYVERDGQLYLTGVMLGGQDQLLNIIRRMAAAAGRRIDELSPMVDARLSDGSRINAIIPPAALDGPMLTIRKFQPFLNDITQLVNEGTLSVDMAMLLHAAVVGRANLLISGGTGSGKTTTLNVLGSLIPVNQRIVTIEDAAELQLVHPHVVRVEHRPPNVEGRGELTLRHLLRNALRMRPDRIIVGEVRGPEALDMLQAMNTGHEGGMSTIHANSSRDALSRLETMVLSGAIDIPLDAVRAQIASAVDLMLHQVRRPDGRRKIVQVAELSGYRPDGPLIDNLFVWEPEREAFVATGRVPKVLAKMAMYGAGVPADIFELNKRSNGAARRRRNRLQVVTAAD